MFITSVSLKDFRNIKMLSLELTQGINILYGDNGQGKTNCLEALYFCATGRSHRTHDIKELINLEKDEAFVRLNLQNGDYSDKINAHIKRQGKKGISVNNVVINKLSELYGTMFCVMFSPEDLQLLKSGPAVRRRFMDMELCQLNSIYYYELAQYYKVLNNRNKLIKSIKRDTFLKDTLFAWDEQLVFHGKKIIDFREAFIDDLNIIAKNIYNDITNFKETLNIHYKPNVTKEYFEEKLAKSFERDMAMGSTTVGIHRDDFVFDINNKDAKVYGSQGQQRTAALCAKLSEITIIFEKKGKMPILMLDDVLSELDSERQQFLLQKIKDVQTILTCTDAENILKKIDDNARLFFVCDGNFKTQ